MSGREIAKVSEADREVSLVNEVREHLEPLISQRLDLKRFENLVLKVLYNNPDLMKAKRASLMLAIVDCAEMGLEPTGRRGGAYLVPYKGQVTLILDFRGKVKLAIRSGAIRSCGLPRLVYTGDTFELEFGDNERLIHIPDLDADHSDKSIRFCYVIAERHDGSKIRQVVTRADIDKAKGASAAANGPWAHYYGAMAQKTVINRLCRFLDMGDSYRDDDDRPAQALTATAAPLVASYDARIEAKSATAVDGLASVPKAYAEPVGKGPASMRPSQFWAAVGPLNMPTKWVKQVLETEYQTDFDRLDGRQLAAGVELVENQAAK